jgi:hydroxymethylbilane synthase
MQKLQNSDWNGAVFAAAGLERINLKPENYIDLDWMVPAPAQGAMVVVAMEKDDFCREALAKLNHSETEICTHIEREFLKTLEGGCTAPIGALAKFNANEIEFEGVLFSLDGKEKHRIKKSCNFDSFMNFGKNCAEAILNNGGTQLMEIIRRDLKK